MVAEASGSPVQGAAGDGPPTELLEAAYAHLCDLGLAAPDAMPSWRLLGGGISNWVILFACDEGVVVKAALPRLRVRDEWLADPSRAVLEGHAMAALGTRLPAGDLPRVLFVDEARHFVGMSCAPPEAYPWKEALLRGEVDTRIAHQVGALLGRLHAAAWGDADLARHFDDLALFHQLRLDPYHERAAQVAEERGDEDVVALLRTGAAA